MFISQNCGMIAGSARDLRPFRLYRPAQVSEAAELLAEGPDIAAYAGGVDWAAGFREGRAPDALVWLSGLEDLKRIDIAGNELRIGALVTHDAGVRNEHVRSVAGLAESWSRIATVRVRFWGTIGGNLMARRTRYEMAILLAALDARLHVTTTQGSRSLAAAELFLADDLDGALLTHVSIPLRDGLRLDYERSLRPTMTQAFAFWNGANGRPAGRVVTATEHIQPVVIDLDLSSGQTAERAAAAAMDMLPATFADPAVSNRYLRHTGGVFLRRQILRTGALGQ